MTQKLKWEGFWSIHWLKFQLVHCDDTYYLTKGRGQEIRLDHILTIESLLNILFLSHAWSCFELQLTLGLLVSEFLIDPGIGCKISKRILLLLKYYLIFALILHMNLVTELKGITCVRSTWLVLLLGYCILFLCV